MGVLSPVGWTAAAAPCFPPALVRLPAPAEAAPPPSSYICRRRPPLLLWAHRLPPPPRVPVVGRTAQGTRRFLANPAGSASGGGFWEDPDDGSGYEEMDGEEDEEEVGMEDEEEGMVSAGSVGGDVTPAAASESKCFRHEVVLLLNPEERAILEQNEAPNLRKISSSKWKPFHTRTLSAQIRFMDDLLQHGIDIDASDKDGLTALHKAVIGKKEAVTSHLLRKGANPHVKDKDGATPLHYAVQIGAIQTVKLLIKYKVDVNVADTDGWTPLHLAIQCRSRDIAKLLLVNGADKSRRNKDGKTPMDLSLCYGRDFKSYELAKLLKLIPANREL